MAGFSISILMSIIMFMYLFFIAIFVAIILYLIMKLQKIKKSVSSVIMISMESRQLIF